MFYDNTKELEHIAELEEQLADAQRALDAERTAKKAYQSTVVDLRSQLATIQAQLEGLEQGCFIHHVDKEQAEMKIALLEGTIGMRATEHIDLLSQLENTEAERDRLQVQLAASQVENSRLIGMAAQQALADTEGQK